MKYVARALSLIPLLAAALGSVAVTSYGQAYVSPKQNVAANIAGKRISIEYYAPSMHGRKIIGELVPFGEVWCTGANWATKITSEAPLEIGGLKLPAGSHTIWTLPDRNEWLLIINNQTGQFHLDYDESRDLGRTRMNVKTLAKPVETLKIELRPGEGNKGTLALLWETTEASIPFTVTP